MQSLVLVPLRKSHKGNLQSLGTQWKEVALCSYMVMETSQITRQSSCQVREVRSFCRKKTHTHTIENLHGEYNIISKPNSTKFSIYILLFRMFFLVYPVKLMWVLNLYGNVMLDRTHLRERECVCVGEGMNGKHKGINWEWDGLKFVHTPWGVTFSVESSKCDI